VQVKKDKETGLPVEGQLLPPEPAFRTAEGLGVVIEREFTVHTAGLAALAEAKKAQTAAKGAATDDGGGGPSSGEALAAGGLSAFRVTALCVYQVRVQASGEEPGDGTTAQVKMLAVADGGGGIYAVSRNGSLAKATQLGRAGDFARDIRKQVCAWGPACVACGKDGSGLLKESQAPATAPLAVAGRLAGSGRVGRRELSLHGALRLCGLELLQGRRRLRRRLPRLRPAFARAPVRIRSHSPAHLYELDRTRPRTCTN
jgi:hypothetical protein